MSESRAKAKSPKEWVKWAMIPVLVVVLGAVLWLPGPSGAGAAADSIGDGTTRPARPERKLAAATSKTDWPSFELAEVMAYSPFDRSAAMNALFGVTAQAEVAPEPEAPDEASLATVTDDDAEPEPNTAQGPECRLEAIYQTAEGAIAIIDSRLVRPGDVLEGGLRVVEITPQAVIVEPVAE